MSFPVITPGCTSAPANAGTHEIQEGAVPSRALLTQELTACAFGIHDAAVVPGSREKIGSGIAQGNYLRSYQVTRSEAGVDVDLHNSSDRNV